MINFCLTSSIKSKARETHEFVTLIFTHLSLRYEVRAKSEIVQIL